MNQSNTIFYSTASSGYAIYSAVSLLTIRDYLPKAKLCILSSGLSDYDKKILNKNNIEYRELDLKNEFTRSWEYPIDCYYIFAGPEFFWEKGYEYSVYVDGDTLCRANPLLGVEPPLAVAGVPSAAVDGEYTSVFGGDWEKIKKVWNLPADRARHPRINSGIVYFNNSKMTDMHLLEKAADLFQKSVTNGIPRKGDDSLFSLLQYVYLSEKDVKHLSPKYNFVLQFNDWRYPVDDLRFFHFSMDKPWKKRPYQHDDAQSMFNPYIKMWRAKFRQTAPRAWLKNVVGLK